MKFTNSGQKHLTLHGVLTDSSRMINIAAGAEVSIPEGRINRRFVQFFLSGIPGLKVDTAVDNEQITDEVFAERTQSVLIPIEKPGTVFVKVAQTREPTEKEKKELSFLYPKDKEGKGKGNKEDKGQAGSESEQSGKSESGKEGKAGEGAGEQGKPGKEQGQQPPAKPPKPESKLTREFTVTASTSEIDTTNPDASTFIVGTYKVTSTPEGAIPEDAVALTSAEGLDPKLKLTFVTSKSQKLESRTAVETPIVAKIDRVNKSEEVTMPETELTIKFTVAGQNFTAKPKIKVTK